MRLIWIIPCFIIISACRKKESPQPGSEGTAKVQITAEKREHDQAGATKGGAGESEYEAKMRRVREFTERCKATDNSYESLRAELAAFLESLPEGSDKDWYANMAIRMLPPESYDAKWKLYHEHGANPAALNAALGLVLELSLKQDPAWAVARLRETEDMALCDRGIQRFLAHYREQGGDKLFLEELGKSFGDSDLYGLGVSYLMAELHGKQDKEALGRLEGLLKDERLDTKTREEVATKFVEGGEGMSAVEKAKILSEAKVSGAAWQSILKEGALLTGEESNQFIEQVSRAGTRELQDLMTAMVQANPPQTVLTGLADRPEEVQGELMRVLAVRIFGDRMIGESAKSLGQLPPESQARLADLLVTAAAENSVPLKEIEPILALKGDRENRLKLYEAHQTKPTK